MGELPVAILKQLERPDEGKEEIHLDFELALVDELVKQRDSNWR